MPAPAKHKDAIVAAAARLFRRQGYAATGVAEIAGASGAPKGSIYHYFPAGKAQIAAEALRRADRTVRATLETLAAESPTAADLARVYARLLAQWLETSNWRDGCPIATVLLEAAPMEADIAEAGREAFDAWAGAIGRAMTAAGAPAARAGRISRLAIACFEGALIQARVAQSTTPLIEAGEEIAGMIQSAVAGATPPVA